MKKYLFIFMIINIFFIINVYADNFLVTPTDLYVNYTSYGQRQESINSTSVLGNAWFVNSNSTGNSGATAIKASYYYDLSSYDYDYFSVSVYTQSHTGNIAINFDSIACESVNSPAGFTTNSSPHGIISTFICQNTKKQDFINIFSINNYGDKIWIGQYISFYDDKNSATIQAAINNQTQQQQQQHQQIMQNDPTTYNNGIESIAGNTQLPNNSGLFDVLSSLSSFVGNLSASGSCSAISVPIPFTTQNLRLPCMTTEVYAPNFPELLAIWQLIVRGLVYYYIIVNMLKLLKDTIDPFSMKLEVLDL